MGDESMITHRHLVPFRNDNSASASQNYIMTSWQEGEDFYRGYTKLLHNRYNWEEYDTSWGLTRHQYNRIITGESILWVMTCELEKFEHFDWKVVAEKDNCLVFQLTGTAEDLVWFRLNQ